MFFFVLLAFLISFASCAFVPPTSETGTRTLKPFRARFAFPLIMRNKIASQSTLATIEESRSEPPTNLIITCRNNSCVSATGEFRCVHENGSVMPPKYHTLLISAHEENYATSTVHYQATVPSSFLRRRLPLFVRWRSAMKDGKSVIHCSRVHLAPLAASGKPFDKGTLNSVPCCHACSWISPKISNPSWRPLCCPACSHLTV